MGQLDVLPRVEIIDKSKMFIIVIGILLAHGILAQHDPVSATSATPTNTTTDEMKQKLVMVIGGSTNTGDGLWTDDIELVSLDSNPVPDCLSSLNPFPYGTITKSAGAAIASDGIPLICGGCIENPAGGPDYCTYTDKCFKYDPIIDFWVEIGTMSGTKSSPAYDRTDSFGLVMANRGDPLEVTQDGINFELLAEVPTDPGCLVILDEKNVLLAGGYANGEVSQRAYIYNKDTNLWREVGNMTEPRLYHSCGIVPSASGTGYEVIVVGGSGIVSGGSVIEVNQSYEIFSIETETFQPGNNMTFGIIDASDIRVDDTFVVVGGRIFDE